MVADCVDESDNDIMVLENRGLHRPGSAFN